MVDLLKLDLFRTLLRWLSPPRESIYHVLPWQWVRVSGPSMVPTLRDGDRVIVRHGAQIRAGDVVLARYRSLPDRLVLKRAVRPDGSGWALVSDNPAAGGGSDVHGIADVAARVVLRIRGARISRVRRQ